MLHGVDVAVINPAFLGIVKLKLPIVGFDIPTPIVCAGDISDIFSVALIKSGPTLSPRSVETLQTRNYSHRWRTQCRKFDKKYGKIKIVRHFTPISCMNA
jgi:hypothetical protein